MFSLSQARISDALKNVRRIFDDRLNLAVSLFLSGLFFEIVAINFTFNLAFA